MGSRTPRRRGGGAVWPGKSQQRTCGTEEGGKEEGKEEGWKGGREGREEGGEGGESASAVRMFQVSV